MLLLSFGEIGEFESLPPQKRHYAEQQICKQCPQSTKTDGQIAEYKFAPFNGCFSEIDFAVAIIRNIRIDNRISFNSCVVTVHFYLH
jgi:hypothetical protein